jgi:Flp pilus assembly protein TadD
MWTNGQESEIREPALKNKQDDQTRHAGFCYRSRRFAGFSNSFSNAATHASAMGNVAANLAGPHGWHLSIQAQSTSSGSGSRLADLSPSEQASEFLRQAEVEFRDGHFAEALRACRQAIRQDRNSAQAYYLLGLIQDRRGAKDQAREAFLQSAKLNPSFIPAYIYLGRLSLQANDLDQAIAEFRSAVRLGDDGLANGHYGLGLALNAESRFGDALPNLRVAVKAHPTDIARLYALAESEIQVGRSEEARALIKQMDSLPAENAEVFYKLGVLLLRHGMSREAETELTRAAALLKHQAGPLPASLNLADLYLILAKLRYEHKDYWEALRYAKRVPVAGLPANLLQESLRIQEESLLGTGRPRDALAKLKELAQTDPSNLQILIRQAWAEMLSGNLKPAEKTVEVLQLHAPQDMEVREITAIAAREGLSPRPSIPMSLDWRIQGEGFVCCSCKEPCPCRSNGAPIGMHCEAAGAFHIARGHYGHVKLTGLVFVTVDEAMQEWGPPEIVYASPLTTDEQLIALERIYQTFNPLGPVFFMNVRRVPLLFNHQKGSRMYELEIPGSLQLGIKRELDSRGQPRMQTAALDFFSNVIEYARSLTFKLWDGSGRLRWDFVGRQANFRSFDLKSSDYREGTMLVQFHDNIGFFNDKQLEIVNRLKLPLLARRPEGKIPERS